MRMARRSAPEARARSGRRCRSRPAAGSRRGRGTTTPPRPPLRRSHAARRGSRRGRRRSPAAPARTGPPPPPTRSRASSSEAPAETGAEPRRSPSSCEAGSPVQSPTCARKSPVGTDGAAVKRMCWKIIAAWWSRHRVRYSISSVSDSASGSTDCSSRCVRNGGRLGALVPLAQLLAPQLALEHLLRAPEAGRELVLRQRDVLGCSRSPRGRRTRVPRTAARRSWPGRRSRAGTARDGPPPSSASPGAGSGPDRGSTCPARAG